MKLKELKPVLLSDERVVIFTCDLKAYSDGITYLFDGFVKHISEDLLERIVLYVSSFDDSSLNILVSDESEV